MIRGAVLRNQHSPVPPGEPRPADPPSEWATYRAELAEFNEAIRIINEYGMHVDGLPYQVQGYRTLEGDVPAKTIDEYLLCKRFYGEANHELRLRQLRK